ncbi:MAG: M23 family metallopeptidase [Chloroflexota bacterium]
MTARIPATQTMQVLQLTETADAPAVQAMFSATAAAINSAVPGQDQFCSADEPYCLLDGHFLFQRPIGAGNNATVDYTYRYGTTQQQQREPHHGVEFPNKQGTPVLAALDGKVIYAANDKQDMLAWVPAYYGNVIVIEHQLPGFSIPFFTLYAHLFKIDVVKGQQVRAGDVIGQVGATGTAIGSHLHFEVRELRNNYRSNRNPELWLKPEPGTGVIAGVIQDKRGNRLKGLINVQRIQDGVLNVIPVTSLTVYEYNEYQPVNADDLYDENFSASGLAEGTYRLTLNYNGQLQEKIVQVQDGKLTFVRFIFR